MVLHAMKRPPGTENSLLSVYRAQLNALILMERALVAQGVIRPEERRVLSTSERRDAGKVPEK